MTIDEILDKMNNNKWDEIYRSISNNQTSLNDFRRAMSQWSGRNGFGGRNTNYHFGSWTNEPFVIGGNPISQYNDKTKTIENIEKHLEKLYEKLGNASTEEEENEILREIEANTEREARLKEDIDSHGGKIGAISSFIKEGVQQLKNIYGVIKDFNTPWANVDDAVSKYTKAIGQSTKQYEALRKNTINNVSTSRIAIDYNMSTEELIKAQQDYAVGAGRNIAVSSEDQENLAAMTAVFGGKANDLAVMFERFGVGLTNTGEHMADMFNEAAKSGISLEKYASNVQRGLALAQTYTFAGGLKSMERMAKFSAKIHMDMEQVRTFADKVGNVEGSITTAARMQVLGGPFASMADPLGMLSESWGDMESLTKRLANITKNMGHFNKATGQVDVDAYNRQRLRAYADATGMDYSQVMETVYQQAKLNEIKAQINSSSAAGLSNEMKELIENTATFKNGRAGVTIGDEFKTLDQLSENDKKELEKLQQTEAHDIKQIARDVASLKDKREGLSKQWDNAKAWISEHFKLGQAEKGGLNFAGHMTGLMKWLAGGTLALRLGGVIVKAFRFFKPKRGLLGDYAGEGNVERTPRRIFSKVNKKGVQTITKGGNTFNKETGIITNSKGTTLYGSEADEAAGKIGLKTGEYARTKAEQEIFKKTSKQATKKGIGSAFAKVGAARKGAEKALTKSVGKVLGKNAYKGLLKVGPKIMKAGGIAGAVGLAGSITEDILLANGKMKKGGAGHTALHIGSKSAEFAGLGTLLGPVGTIAGAALGTIVGSVQMAKIKRKMGLDNKLAQMGIERKGDYGAKKLKKIDKALTTGKISRKVRRKMEREGDFEMLAQIDAAKEQKREEKIARKEKRKSDRLERIKARNGNSETVKRIRHATFYVDVANFEGRAFGVKKIKPNTNNGVSILSAPQESLSNTARILTNSNSRNNLNSQNIGPNKIEPIDININGTLKLEGKGGQSVDIIDMLKKDKTLERAIIDLLAPSIEKEIRNRKGGGGSAANNQSYGDSAR